MFVVHEGKKKTVASKKSMTVDALLKKMSINPELVLVKRKDEILLEDDEVSSKDTVEILRVVSGG